MTSLKDKITGFFTEEYDEEEETIEEETIAGRSGRHNNINNFDIDGNPMITNIDLGLEEALKGKQSKVLVLEPKVFSEAQEIAEHLLQKRAAIVNLQKITPDQGKRIIDFLSGTIYAINGDLKKVSNNTFLCTPNTFGVAGKISEDEVKKI